ncbi:MAG TPA: hypothetical protein VMW11_07260 [Candidatus Dormibacteraeota bacterium]|nr:hypothetical protein [Candidatus Dormibacteraeota bacterium]
MQRYIDALTSLGFTGAASAGDLPPPSGARSATNAFIAPQFAMGTAPKAYAFVWRINNLVVIVRAGGDVSITNDQALRWAMLFNSNVPRQ